MNKRQFKRIVGKLSESDRAQIIGKMESMELFNGLLQSDLIERHSRILDLLKAYPAAIGYVDVNFHVGTGWGNSLIDGKPASQDGSDTPFSILEPDGFRDYWRITVNFSTGRVLGWPSGKTMSVRYMVGNDADYIIKDKKKRCLFYLTDCPVPKMLAKGTGANGMMEFDIGEDGRIANWNPELKDLFEKINGFIDDERNHAKWVRKHNLTG